MFKEYLTYKGTTLSLVAWAKRVGLSRKALAYRIESGRSTERALTKSATNGNNQHTIY